MIDKFISVSLKENAAGRSISILSKTYKSISLSYPCGSNSHICTPYIVNIKRGVYKFECLGSIGGNFANAGTPGKGGYTAGTIYLKEEETRFYVYIGATGFYNAVKEKTSKDSGPSPGGATDIRIKSFNNWWDQTSLASRIMVAGGGGGAEWKESIGGNGGNIEGGSSTFQTYKCPGGNQTSGSTCEKLGSHGQPASGTFGSAGITQPFTGQGWWDYGGYGGGGYYGGTSYSYSYPGSGGSSFISGHKGCDAVKSETDISPSGDSIHYSGYVFYDTEMIQGNITMPFPDNLNKGIHEGIGAFRITLLLFQQKCTYKQRLFHISFLINSICTDIVIK